MPSRPRRDIIDESRPGKYHVTSRCVRRARLMGEDPRTGKNFDHRKTWIKDRVSALVGVFAVECLDITVMSNHLHLILRNRPDIVAKWSDEEVARRWLLLHRQILTLLNPAGRKRIRRFLRNPKNVRKARRRLSSISWFMAYLKEPISRAANNEDDVTGAFWSGRFWCEELTEPESTLAVSLYVNLNPIRAGLAKRPEDAKFTSVYERIRDLLSGDPNLPNSGWLSPVSISGDGYAGAAAKRRASDEGFLSLTFAQYLELLDGMIRREEAERNGGVFDEYPPILERLGITASAWESSIRKTSRRFAREMEKSQKLLDEMQDRRQGGQ